MPRAFLLVLDSLGVGGAPDASSFGDAGANTLLHIADRMPLALPHLASLGLGLAAQLSAGRNPLLSRLLSKIHFSPALNVSQLVMVCSSCDGTKCFVVPLPQ